MALFGCREGGRELISFNAYIIFPGTSYDAATSYDVNIKHISKYMYYKEGFGKPDLADTTYSTIAEVSVRLVPNQTKVIQFNYALDHTVFDFQNPRNLTLNMDPEGKVLREVLRISLIK